MRVLTAVVVVSVALVGDARGPHSGDGRASRSGGFEGCEAIDSDVVVKFTQRQLWHADSINHSPLAPVQASQEEMFRVLQGMHLPEDRFNDHLAPGINSVAFLRFQFAGHPLFGCLANIKTT